MRLLVSLATMVLAACATAPAPVAPSAPHITGAIADARRPAEDRARDDARKPADMLAFAGVRPGMRVGELIPGTGYFSRLFAVAVGDEGRVYPVIRPPQPNATGTPLIMTIAEQYPNMQVVRQEFASMRFPEPLDVVWTSQNYHDVHIAQYSFLGPIDDVNRRAFEALRPGGIYIVLDHAAADGSGVRDAESLHRIDQAFVRAEVEAVGFVYHGESNALRNAEDARTLSVFDESIRGRTDQFVMRFRKPE